MFNKATESAALFVFLQKRVSHTRAHLYIKMENETMKK